MHSTSKSLTNLGLICVLATVEVPTGLAQTGNLFTGGLLLFSLPTKEASAPSFVYTKLHWSGIDRTSIVSAASSNANTVLLNSGA
jgi:hypothetical protein